MAVIGFDIYEDDVFEHSAVFADFTSDYVDRLDVLNKLVFLKKTVTVIHPVDDMYAEVRSIRRVDESARGMDNPISAQGNEPAGANFTPRRAVFNDGWRIAIEFESNHNVSFTGEMISDDGLAGAQLVNVAYLPAGVSTLINYTPPSSEVIEVATGGLTTGQEAKLTAIPTAQENAVAIWADTDAVTLKSDINNIQTDVVFIKAVESGRWKIEANQMIFFDTDNVTELLRFNLYDASGNPTMANPFERSLV